MVSPHNILDNTRRAGWPEGLKILKPTTDATDEDDRSNSISMTMIRWAWRSSSNRPVLGVLDVHTNGNIQFLATKSGPDPMSVTDGRTDERTDERSHAHTSILRRSLHNKPFGQKLFESKPWLRGDSPIDQYFYLLLLWPGWTSEVKKCACHRLNSPMGFRFRTL